MDMNVASGGGVVELRRDSDEQGAKGLIYIRKLKGHSAE